MTAIAMRFASENSAFLGHSAAGATAAFIDFAGQGFNGGAAPLSPLQQGEMLRSMDQSAAARVITVPVWPARLGAQLAAPAQLPPSVPISPRERQLLASGTIEGVNAFWQSRFERGDPVAVTARQFGWARSQMSESVQIADNMLRHAIKGRITQTHPNDPSVYRTEYQRVSGEGLGPTIHVPRQILTAKGQALVNGLYNKVRFDLAIAHKDAILVDARDDNDGVRAALNVDQVSDYHWAVFGANGLSAKTFGGSPVFGSRFEAWATSSLGLWGKGYDPK